MRASRSLRRAATDRRAQVAAGTLVVASAAAAGKVAADRLAEDDGHSGPSRAYRLKTKEGVGDGIRRIVVGRAEKALQWLDAAAEGDGDLAEAIHGARKDLKKIRAVLRLVRAELGDELYGAENERYRDAGRLLSESRDAEVKLQTLSALRGRFDEDLPADAARRWKESLRRERDEIAGAGAGALPDRIGQASRAIEEGRDAENVHEWRKRSKDLWYQLRIVREAWPQPLEATGDQAHELADLLGDHHDLAILDEDLASRPEVGEREAIGKLIERRQHELVDPRLGDRQAAVRGGGGGVQPPPQALLASLARSLSLSRSTSRG